MARTISLTKSFINSIVINPKNQTIAVAYQLTNNEGTVSERHEVFYVRELPLDNFGQPIDNSDGSYKILTTAQFNYVAAIFNVIKNDIDSLLV